MIRRRTFIAGLGSVAAWPAVARAQQGDRMRRIGVLMNGAPDDPEAQTRNAAFLQGLQEWGWTIGRNVRIDTRWALGNTDRLRRYATELAALAPDVIQATGASGVAASQLATRTIPIVFANVTDPVGAGLIASVARPGGNTTGFMFTEYGMSGKVLELLKQIAPRVRRAAVLRDPTVAGQIGQFAAIGSVAPSLGVEVSPVDGRDAGDIERAITEFARQPSGGLIVVGSSAVLLHRGLIIALAAKYGLPAIAPYRIFVTDGGLISYGPDSIDQYRQAARYVDRILRGEKPADLPVQAPTKYETAINLKTAKALGLTIPETLLATADEVIQ
jgi:putative ABC transport system substrate-binding protein